MSENIQILDETGRWRARNVQYWGGSWNQLRDQIPVFTMEDFRAADDNPPNPYLKTVVRQPNNLFEKPIPVAIVSNSYTLAQHIDVAEKCFEGICSAGIKIDDLFCEVGMTELGEWMNLRIHFPDQYNYTPSDGNDINLKLECHNSVDGSSRLTIFLGWRRLICSNGLVIGETLTEFRDIHDHRLNIGRIPKVVCEVMKLVVNDKRRLISWEDKILGTEIFKDWINKSLADDWGKKAACRVYHICTSGNDVEYEDPFAPGDPTDKPVKRIKPVPGSPEKAKTFYDVCVALSWVATGRMNPEERLKWQSSITDLIDKLDAA